MTERWGIKGDGWLQVRHVTGSVTREPSGEMAARGWACSLSGGSNPEPISLYRNTGDGWVLVDRYIEGRNDLYRDALERGTDL